MRKITLLIVFFICTISAFAQAPDWGWVHTAQLFGSGTANAFESAVDSNGNIYVVGTFTSTTAFGNISLVNTTGVGQMYLVKYSPSGEVLWGRSSTSPNLVSGFSLAIDTDGNIFVSGSFSSAITFGTVTINTPNNSPGFVVKFDNNGNTVWAKTLESSSVIISKIKFDSNNNLYIIGGFTGNMLKFGDNTLNIPANYTSIFILKCSNDGEIIWGKREEGSNFAFGYEIAIDNQENIYVAGIFNCTPLGTTIGTTTIECTDNTYVVIAKYNDAGESIWVRTQKVTGELAINCKPTGIGVDSFGNVTVLGMYYSTVTISGTTYTSLGNFDNVIVKYSNAGDVLWVKRFTSIYPDYSQDLIIDDQDNTYIASASLSDEYNISGTLLNLYHPGNAIITKLDNNGDVLWNKTIGCDSEIVVNSLFSNNGNLTLCGIFYTDTAYFDNFSLTSETPNMFAAKLGQSAMEIPEISSSVNLYPNPAKDILNINNESAQGQLYTITDMTGRTIKSGIVENVIDVSSLSSGIFVLNIGGITSKFIKE